MRRVLAASVAFILLGLLIPVSAAADPGPNYTEQGGTSWVTAGSDASLYFLFKPATDYWKLEMRLQCPGGSLQWDAYEGVSWKLWKNPQPTGTPWASDYDPLTAYTGNGVHDFDYPGGSGVTGYHTPDYSDWWVLEVTTPDQGHVDGIAPCQFRAVIMEHT